MVTTRQYDVNFLRINLNLWSQQSNFMAELIYLTDGKCDLKFHALVKNFKRVEALKFKNVFYKLYIDKNDSVYDIALSEVLTWKTIKKGKREINVPDSVVEIRQTDWLNKFRGNPTKIAITKMLAELEAQELLS